MSIVNQIRTDMLQAKREHNPNAAFLSMVYADVVAVGKNAANRETTDVEAIQSLKKAVKSLDEMIQISTQHGKTDEVEKASVQKALVEKYLPAQMTSDELKTVVEAIISGLSDKSPKAMGQVMATLKQRHEGLYDGREASALVKSMLAG